MATCEPFDEPDLGAFRPPTCAWCAGTFGQVTREMRQGLPSPPPYLCEEHQARWDGLVAANMPLLRRELFHIPGGQGVMQGIPKRLSVSASAAAALGLADDPMLKVARDAVQDDLDRQRWEILRDAAAAATRPTICGAGQTFVASDPASRTIEGEVVESDAEVPPDPGSTPVPDGN